MNRATAKYVIFLIIAIICFHWKTLLTDQYTTLVGSEGVNQTYGWLHFWLGSIRHFGLPLWDPYSFAGRPFAGETQTTAYYPLRLLFALVPLNKNGVVSPRFYHEYLAFNRFLGACFMFALLRELRRSRFAAFIGACAFSMGGLLGRLPWPQHMEACIWLPATLLFLLRSFRADGTRRAFMEASLAGFCLGLSILTGGIQFAMMEGICALLMVLYFVISHRSSPEFPACRRRAAIVLGALVAMAIGMGAVQLAPSFEYGHYALRFIKGGWFPMAQKIPYDRMDSGSPPQSILTGLFPVGGGPVGGEFWPYYVGALPMFLAVWAIWRCRERIWVRFFIGLGVFAFVYALGEFSPLNGVIYAVVPYIWNNREPARFFYLLSFSLSALAAFGIDNLLNRGADIVIWPQARPVIKWVAIIAAAGMVLPGILSQVTVGAWTYLSLTFIVASCAALGYLIRQSPSPSGRLLLAAFLLFDLGAFYWGAGADQEEVIRTGDQYQQMLTLSSPAAFIKSLPGLNRVRVPINPEPNIGDVYGIQSFWGGGVTVLENFSRVSQRENLLNVRYRIKPASDPGPGAIYTDKHWKVYEDNTAYPRAWLVHQSAVAPSDDDVFNQADRLHLDLHEVGLMHSALPQALEPVATGDSVRFTAYSANSMALHVNTAGRGLLILSEIFYPGWNASVNGRSVEIYKVDGGLRGIPVSRGDSRIVLDYAPMAEYLSAALALITTIVCGWFGFQIWRTPLTGAVAPGWSSVADESLQ